MTDEELVHDIQKSEEALKELMFRYRPIIYDIIHRHYSVSKDFNLDKDDLLQVGYIALYQAAKSYDDKHNTRFITYAYTLIKRSIQKETMQINHIYYNEGKSIDTESSIDKMSFASNRMYDDPRRVLMYKETISHMKGFRKCLTDQEKEILRLREEELTYNEIAKRLNISSKRVDNSLQGIKRKYKHYEAS